MPPKKPSGGATKLTEEELLLLESSRHVSMATSALFYGNAFIVSALPLCRANDNIVLLIILLYYRVVLAYSNDGSFKILCSFSLTNLCQYISDSICLP